MRVEDHEQRIAPLERVVVLAVTLLPCLGEDVVVARIEAVGNRCKEELLASP